LVITNWHVVRDGHGEAEVIFPDGFRSPAKPLKVDADWDLAALVIWRPRVAPVKIAASAPQPGDQLTICGYGSGRYRAISGRCTQYYAPKMNLPQHMVELDVEARQGDSGGPIFNEHGELAGVLFGAGSGTTLGSFGGRVGWFLGTLAPDIGRATDLAMAMTPTNNPKLKQGSAVAAVEPTKHSDLASNVKPAASSEKAIDPKASVTEALAATPPPTSKSSNELITHGWHAVAAKTQPATKATSAPQPVSITLDLRISTILAAIGVLAAAAQLVRAAR
jgi:serine protease Do